MNKFNVLFYIILVPVVLTMSVFSFDVSSCECRIPSVCLSYTRAEAVFVGRLDKIERSRDDFQQKLTFVVKERLKGDPKNETVMYFIRNNCSTLRFVEGERYLVYFMGTNDILECDPTRRFSPDDPYYVYAKSLKEDDPIFTIHGSVTGLSENELGKTTIEISEGDTIFPQKLDEHGRFSLTVRKSSNFRVRIKVPFKAGAELWAYPVMYMPETEVGLNGTTFEYEVQFAPNACDDRELQIWKTK